jgi:hypothetical protein
MTVPKSEVRVQVAGKLTSTPRSRFDAMVAGSRVAIDRGATRARAAQKRMEAR